MELTTTVVSCILFVVGIIAETQSKPLMKNTKEDHLSNKMYSVSLQGLVTIKSIADDSLESVTTQLNSVYTGSLQSLSNSAVSDEIHSSVETSARSLRQSTSEENSESKTYPSTSLDELDKYKDISKHSSVSNSIDFTNSRSITSEEEPNETTSIQLSSSTNIGNSDSQDASKTSFENQSTFVSKSDSAYDWESIHDVSADQSITNSETSVVEDVHLDDGQQGLHSIDDVDISAPQDLSKYSSLIQSKDSIDSVATSEISIPHNSTEESSAGNWGLTGPYDITPLLRSYKDNFENLLLSSIVSGGYRY